MFWPEYIVPVLQRDVVQSNKTISLTNLEESNNYSKEIAVLYPFPLAQDVVCDSDYQSAFKGRKRSIQLSVKNNESSSLKSNFILITNIK